MNININIYIYIHIYIYLFSYIYITVAAEGSTQSRRSQSPGVSTPIRAGIRFFSFSWGIRIRSICGSIEEAPPLDGLRRREPTPPSLMRYRRLPRFRPAHRPAPTRRYSAIYIARAPLLTTLRRYSFASYLISSRSRERAPSNLSALNPRGARAGASNGSQI